MSQNLTGSIVFGAIEENYIDENGKYICQGYCQKAGSKENVTLDIYIDDERIAQIEANEHIKPIEDTYMIDGHCFTYEVDTDYCDRDKTLFIKEHDSQQELMHSGLKLKYNEPLFLNSLDALYPRKQLKGMYQKDTFGFLALEENLDDERFTDYLKELMQRFEKARWSAFCFTKKQRELLEQTLGEYSAKIECILPKNIKDIALGCEVFIYSKQKRTDRSQSAPFDKLSTQIANNTDLFQIMLTPEGETELILGSELEYTKSIVSQIFAGDKEEAFYKFMDINATIDAQKLKTLHKKDHIGFFASVQNLNNRSFVSYVKKLHKSFPQLHLVAFYFHDEELELFKKSFDEDAKDIKALKPKDIYDFAQNIEIFLHNKLASSPNLNLLSRALKEKMNLFEMTLTKIVSLEPKVELTHVECEIDFSQSIVSKIFEFDERFNEYRFLNSFAVVDKENIKDMYCPNAIGFLATEENLADEEFVGYIQELMVRFPDVEFKGFCFSNEIHLFDSSIKPIKVNDIRQLAQHITILLTNPSTIMERTLIQSYFKNRFAILTHNKININMKIKDVINENLITLYKNNLDTFGLTYKDIRKYPNHILLASLVLSKSLNNEFKNILLNQEHTVKEHTTKIITLLLQDKDFFYAVNKQRKTIRSLLLKG